MEEESSNSAVKPKAELKLYSSATSAVVGTIIHFDAYLTEEGEPVAGIEVKLKDERGDVIAVAKTDKAGHVIFPYQVRGNGNINVKAVADL